MIQIEVADVVFHRPTRVTLVVRKVHGTYLSWFGWPPGAVLVSDCLLVEKAGEFDRARAALAGGRSDE